MWIRSAKPPIGTIVFWGPKELLLHRGKQWIFNDKEIPPTLAAAMDSTSPMELEPSPVKAGGAASAM
jgi:hypothetical protein